MKRRFSQFMLDDSGATAIEYGLIASGICVAVITAVQALGGNVKTMLFDEIVAALP